MDLYQIFVTYNKIWTIREIVCFIILFFVVAIITMYFVRKGSLRWRQAIAGLFAFVFLAVVFGSTVFTRNPGQNRLYELELFWSWREVLYNQRWALLTENLLNCILLMPIGLLLPLIRNKRVNVLNGFVVGFLISAAIETCQLVLRRGLFEWDDMIHNAIGCMVGCLLMNLFWKKKH